MPVRTIVKLGHPALRSVAAPVEAARLAGHPPSPLPALPPLPPLPPNTTLEELIEDMVETMRAAHGVGLAAPQLGVGLQIFVYEVDRGAERGDEEGNIPLHVVINPMITPEPGEPVYDWEGCLSIPDLRGLVPRHPAVRVRGLDCAGQPLDYQARGFEARIVQHELDHLNGVVFLDRMHDLKALAFLDEWERYLAPSPGPPEEPALG